MFKLLIGIAAGFFLYGYMMSQGHIGLAQEVWTRIVSVVSYVAQLISAGAWK